MLWENPVILMTTIYLIFQSFMQCSSCSFGQNQKINIAVNYHQDYDCDRKTRCMPPPLSNFVQMLKLNQTVMIINSSTLGKLDNLLTRVTRLNYTCKTQLEKYFFPNCYIHKTQRFSLKIKYFGTIFSDLVQTYIYQVLETLTLYCVAHAIDCVCRKC